MNINILHIDSGANLNNSFSRIYSKKIVDKIISVKNCDNYKIFRRDLVTNPVPFVTADWRFSYCDPKEINESENVALSISNALINELFASDYIVIGSPMHNFTISSYLKLYIDQICRRGKTFSRDFDHGLLKDKQVFVIMTRGGDGFEVGERQHNMNQQEPYFHTIFKFIGIENYKLIILNGLSYPEKAKISCEKADKEIENLVIK